jgi:hypothetical protein
MFTYDRPSVEQIEAKLRNSIDWQNDGIEDVLAALLRVFIFVMASTCSNCRKNIARKLRRSVPDMLSCSNALATRSSLSGNCNSLH